jgi:hypothetical protein
MMGDERRMRMGMRGRGRGRGSVDGREVMRRR